MRRETANDRHPLSCDAYSMLKRCGDQTNANLRPAEVLLATDRWAARNIIEVCENLSKAEFHRNFEIASGSLVSEVPLVLLPSGSRHG